ncbi:MAG: LamG domain-containing protein, partial [Verrucomicrobiota bacterium]
YGGGYQFNMTSPNSVNDGKWHHIAAVRRNGTNGVIYIDGGAAVTQNTTTIAPLLGTLATFIGADKRDSGTYFTGLISDVAVYPYALTASRIGIHAYNGLLGNSGFSVSLVPGGFISDTKPVGTPHNGLNNNSVWTNSITDGAFPAVTRTGVEMFNGNGQINIPASPDFDSASGTFTFWLRANAPIPGPGAEAAMLVDRRIGTNGAVIVLDDGGAIAWQGPGASRNEIHAGYVPDNNWHHVAVTYGQTTSDTIEIFIDGASAGSVTVTNGWSWPATQQIEIGRSHDTYWKVLNGQLDDFRIYNRVLTPTEIASVQSTGALVDTTALKVRFNFDTTSVGTSLSWPVGSLQSSPTLGPTAVWTDVPGAVSPYPFLPPAPGVPAGGSLFYRAGL